MKKKFNTLLFSGVVTGIVIGVIVYKTGSFGHPLVDRQFKLGQTLQYGIANEQAHHYTISSLDSSSIYEMLISGVSPSAWSLSTRLDAKLELPGGKEIEKVLHSGDPDFYCMVQPEASGPATLVVSASGAGAPVRYQVLMQRLPVSADNFTSFGRLPDSNWRHARPMRLGHTVFASADEIEYLDNTQEGKNGLDWYTFTFRDPKPKLVMFDIDVLDRDVPMNLSLFKAVRTPEGIRLREYTEGKDPEEIKHDMQTQMDSKLITRVLTPGKYYLEVKANHPAYQLRTYLDDVPPYKDPHQAVQTAMDYLIAEADSWFAHTPRGGSRRTRVENVTDETERCVACHAGHFTMRGSLEAVKNGYSIHSIPQFKFMMDKLYNSMAPFYGLSGVDWLRFDLAPGDGIGRMARMILYYENYVSHRPTSRPADAAGYLELVYKDRRQLPPNEFDGNRPVPRYKVAGDAYYDLNQLYRRTGLVQYRESRDKIESLILDPPPTDMEGLCEQTIAMVEMGNPKFRPQIEENVRKILAGQHDDGTWWTPAYAHSGGYNPAIGGLVTPVAPEDKSKSGQQFITAEAVYALVKAGAPPTNPQVHKAVKYLLSQQRNFGAWLDYRGGELFLTPFLESMWAVKALSTVYPEHNPAIEPDLALRRFDPDHATFLETMRWLDGLWYVHDPAAAREAVNLVRSPYVIERQAAAAALGKMAVDAGKSSEVAMMQAPLVEALNDPSKLVRRAAAWSLRQILNDGYEVPGLLAAMNSPSDRTRMGATRVFAQYFYFAVPRTEYLQALINRLDDPDVLVRIQATKALWRWCNRTPNLAWRGKILDALLSRMSNEPSPYEKTNLSEALYNVLDENIGLMYTYWLPTISSERARSIAHQAQFRYEYYLAAKISKALNDGDAEQKQVILQGLGDYFLRARIGNDLDFLTFYSPQAADLMVGPLLKLMRSFSPQIRVEAVKAAVIARNASDVRLKAALLRAATDPSPAVRTVAAAAAPELPTLANPTISVEAMAAPWLLKSDKTNPAPGTARSYGSRKTRRAYRGSRLVAAVGDPPFAPFLSSSVANRRTQLLGARSASAPAVLSRNQALVILPILKALLESHFSRARMTALDWLDRDPATQTDAMAKLVLSLARSETDTQVLASAVPNFGWILQDEPSAFGLLASLARRKDTAIQEALFQVLTGDAFGRDPRTPELVMSILKHDPDDPETQQRVLDLVAGPDANSRRQTGKITAEALQANPAVLAWIAVIGRRGGPAEAIESSRILSQAFAAKRQDGILREQVHERMEAELAKLPARPQSRTHDSATEPLDFSFFVARVQPILERERYGKTRCMDCHAVSANLSRNHLVRPLPSGQYTESAVWSNYASILSLVNLRDPETSYILRKPLAVAAGGTRVHTGGKYWTSKANPEYQTILAWIDGARLTSPTPSDQRQLSRIISDPTTGLPSFRQFEARIEPILDKKYGIVQDQSCMSCHSQVRESGQFHLIPPDSEGRFSQAKLYANYLSCVEFLNLRDIVKSPILLEPLNPQSAGFSVVHPGGALWLDRRDPDYRTIAAWAQSVESSRQQSRREAIPHGQTARRARNGG
jgi:cellulose synthase operon protein C